MSGRPALHRIDTEIGIAAPAARVWAVLADLPGHARWNPFLTAVAGDLAVGGRLTVLIRAPGRRAMRIRPTLLVVDAGRELRWRGRLLAPGVFTGEHHFRIEPRGADGVVFHQGERFAGVLVPLMRGYLDGVVRQGFVAMNEALRQEAERA